MSNSILQPRKTERSHEENQERAYIAASRRTDRSLEARVQSARMASEIHRKRTGKGFKITEEIVQKEEMYEEEDDDFMRLRRGSMHRYPFSGYLNSQGGTFMDNQQVLATLRRESEIHAEFERMFGGINPHASRTLSMGVQPSFFQQPVPNGQHSIPAPAPSQRYASPIPLRPQQNVIRPPISFPHHERTHSTPQLPMATMSPTGSPLQVAPPPYHRHQSHPSASSAYHSPTVVPTVESPPALTPSKSDTSSSDDAGTPQLGLPALQGRRTSSMAPVPVDSTLVPPAITDTPPVPSLSTTPLSAGASTELPAQARQYIDASANMNNALQYVCSNPGEMIGSDVSYNQYGNAPMLMTDSMMDASRAFNGNVDDFPDYGLGGMSPKHGEFNKLPTNGVMGFPPQSGFEGTVKMEPNMSQRGGLPDFEGFEWPGNIAQPQPQTHIQAQGLGLGDYGMMGGGQNQFFAQNSRIGTPNGGPDSETWDMWINNMDDDQPQQPQLVDPVGGAGRDGP